MNSKEILILFRWASPKLRATRNTSRRSSSPSLSNFAIVLVWSSLRWCQNSCRYLFFTYLVISVTTIEVLNRLKCSDRCANPHKHPHPYNLSIHWIGASKLQSTILCSESDLKMMSLCQVEGERKLFLSQDDGLWLTESSGKREVLSSCPDSSIFINQNFFVELLE